MKEAYALACGNAEQAATASESAQRFVQEHLANIAQPLANSLEGSGIPYLAKAGAALLRRVGPPPATAALQPVLQEEVERDDLSCGGIGSAES